MSLIGHPVPRPIPSVVAVPCRAHDNSRRKDTGRKLNMQVNVLGTSNSILRGGWVDGLRDTIPDPDRVVNLSVGASSSAFVLWQLADSGLPGRQPDTFYLVDTLVNDETFIAAKNLQAVWWNRYQRHLLRILPPQRTCLVGFSSRKFFDMPSTEAMWLESLSAAHGTSFVSLRRILREALTRARQVRPDANVDDIFEDPGHFHRHLSCLFGKWLGKALSDLIAAPDSDGGAMPFPFETLCPEDHDGIEETRHTTLREQRTALLPTGTTFTLPGDRILHGICVDASNTRCILDIDAGPGNRVSLELAYNSNSPRMQVKFVHFQSPLVLGSEGAVVRIVQKPEFRLIKGVHSRPNDGPYHGLRLLSFLSGPMEEVEMPPPFPPPDAPNVLIDMENRCLEEAGLVEVISDPPDLPRYPRSFIEL